MKRKNLRSFFALVFSLSIILGAIPQSTKAADHIADSFQLPVKNASSYTFVESFGFGEFYDNIFTSTGEDGYHGGSDFSIQGDYASAYNKPVYAAADGYVIYAANANYPGSVILIRHTLPDNSTIYTQYGHLINLQVSANTWVEKGQYIANIYNWGDNSHLHFEVRSPEQINNTYYGPGYWKTTLTNPGYTDPIDYLAAHPVNTLTTFVDGGQWHSNYGETSDIKLTGDFTGDNRTDVLVATLRVDPNVPNDYAYYVMKSDESYFTYYNQWMASYGLEGDEIVVGDYTGDGKDDVLVGVPRINGDTNANTKDLAWYLMTSNGTSFVNQNQVILTYGEQASTVSMGDKFFAADIDADGKDDLVRAKFPAPGSTSTLIDWYVSKSNGTSFQTPIQLNSGFGKYNDQFHFADANADNKEDLYQLSHNYNGDGLSNTQDMQLRISLSNGSSLDSGRITISSYGLLEDKLYIADFNGDRINDLVLGTLRVNNSNLDPNDNNSYSWYVATINSNLTSSNDLGSVNNSFGLSGDTILLGDYKNNNTENPTVDIAFGRDVFSDSNAQRWWVMYSD